MKYILAGILVLLLSGCATPIKSSPDIPDIVVSEGGRIKAFGKDVIMADVSRAIRKQHLSNEYAVRILVLIKEGEDRRLMTEISSQMLAAEHTLFYFVRPKSATSRVLQPGESVKFEKTDLPSKSEIKQ